MILELVTHISALSLYENDIAIKNFRLWIQSSRCLYHIQMSFPLSKNPEQMCNLLNSSQA